MNLDNGMNRKDATLRAMEAVSGPVVAIACILAAVFIPVAFIGGISGQIYRQFALTIAASVLISAFNALSLSPALCGHAAEAQERIARAFWERPSMASIKAFDWSRDRYLSGVKFLVRRFVFALCGPRRVLFARRQFVQNPAHRLLCPMKTRASSSRPFACPMALRSNGPGSSQTKSRRSSGRLPAWRP